MKRIMKLAFLFMVLIGANLVAAPHSFLPIEATQPDGSKITMYASGDEFHNWLHDENNYTIVRDESGAYVYAIQERGSLVPSDLLVGRDSPNVRSIAPGLNLSQAEIRAKYDLYAEMRDYSSNRAPHTGQLNNIVIFIKFSDSPDFSTPLSNYQQMFNASAANSMKRYFQAASYNQLTVDSYFYPAPVGNTVICYQDTLPRSYFQLYHITNNPNGYSGDTERKNREHALLQRAVDFVNTNSPIPTSLNIDGDNDGLVDNVCFIIQGQTDAWANLLWPHQWSLYSVTVNINGKRVYNYNFQLENSLNNSGTSVLAHEMFHSLGAPDLYRYVNKTIVPIGSWDLMATNLNPPQHMSAWMKHKYGQWINSDNVPTITTSGTYTLSPVASSSTNNIYRLNSWKANEYYLLEYRKSDGTYDGNLPGTGLLVYRLDATKNGNAQGPPDELYIYRPGGTNDVNGTLSQAHFSQQIGRTEISEATTPSGFLGDGSAGGLNLFDVGYAGDTISFKVKVSDIQLTYPHGGEVWQSGENKEITWKSKSTAGNVKLECSSDGGQSWNLIATGLNNTGSFTWNFVPSMNNSTNVHIRVSLIGTNHSDSNYYPFTVSGISLNPARHLIATSGNGTVSLAWQAPLFGIPTGYSIYRNGSLLTTVTDLSYTDNAVVNGTIYSYYVVAAYSSGISIPSNTVQAMPANSVLTEVIIGTGNTTTTTVTPSPINVSFQSLHGQSVYTAAELNAAGVVGSTYITQIGFDIKALPDKIMPNYIIRMGHTNAIDASDWITTGLVQVWSSSTYQPVDKGWNMFTLSTPFLWNGVDNIVVDTAFSLIGSTSSTGTVMYTAAYNGYRYAISNDTDQTNVFNVGATSIFRPNLKLALGSSIINISSDALYANLQVGAASTRSFVITNTGRQALDFNINLEELTGSGSSRTVGKASGQGKSIAGSTLTLNTTNYQPGSTVNWTFTVYNGSVDSEWIKDVSITFPKNVTVNSVTNLVGGSGGNLTPSVTGGNTTTITWSDVSGQGFGFIQGGQSASATVNVTIGASLSGDLSLPWTITGDGWASLPHTLSGSIVLTERLSPVSWLIVQPLFGTIPAGASATITASFSAEGMAVGSYQALLTIQSNDPENPVLNVNAGMNVWEGSSPTEILPGVDYLVDDLPGVSYNSSHNLIVVDGIDETTPEIAALPNLNPATAFIAGYSGTGSNVTLTFNITAAGTYHLIGFWGGNWHQADPFPLVVSPTDNTIVLSGINFTAKSNVYVVLSNGGDPSTLPVELSHFSATVTAENFVQLTWVSQTESNLLGYNVYRNAALDLSSAIKISGMIEGTNTSTAQTYIYVDEELEQSGTYYYWLQNVDLDGSSSYHGPVSVLFDAEAGTVIPPIPLVTRLENAYPNPFNPDTAIPYQLKDPAKVKIDIYNLKGQLVRSFEQSHDTPGYYRLIWNGCDRSGKALASGVYLYKMSCGSYHAAKKVILKK